MGWFKTKDGSEIGFEPQPIEKSKYKIGKFFVMHLGQPKTVFQVKAPDGSVSGYCHSRACAQKVMRMHQQGTTQFYKGKE